jgi:DNA-directed RNA polymerase specialized sigma24 family protein
VKDHLLPMCLAVGFTSSPTPQLLTYLEGGALRDIQAAVARYPSRTQTAKAVFHHVYIDGLSQVETARRLQVSQATVSQHLKNVLSFVRAELAESHSA